MSVNSLGRCLSTDANVSLVVLHSVDVTTSQSKWECQGTWFPHENLFQKQEFYQSWKSNRRWTTRRSNFQSGLAHAARAILKSGIFLVRNVFKPRGPWRKNIPWRFLKLCTQWEQYWEALQILVDSPRLYQRLYQRHRCTSLHRIVMMYINYIILRLLLPSLYFIIHNADAQGFVNFPVGTPKSTQTPAVINDETEVVLAMNGATTTRVSELIKQN